MEANIKIKTCSDGRIGSILSILQKCIQQPHTMADTMCICIRMTSDT